MDRAEIEAALTDLGAELERRGVRAKLWVVGGAVMVLAFQSRDATSDVDGAAYPATTVFELARGVAHRRGLSIDWLNDHAAAWLPHTEHDESWLPVRRYGGLEVFLADERMMLALKLRASRGQRDYADIKVLLRECRVRTESEALAIYDEFFPDDPLPRVHRAALREALEEVLAGPSPPDFDFEDIVSGHGTKPARKAAVVSAERPARARRPSENDLLWFHSPQGSVSHRATRQDGDEVLTVCGQRLKVRGLRGGRSPKKRPCERCSARRPR